MALFRSVLSNTICPHLIFTLLTLQGEERRSREGFGMPINRFNTHTWKKKVMYTLANATAIKWPVWHVYTVLQTLRRWTET